MVRGIVFITYALCALGVMTYGAIQSHRNPDRNPSVFAIIAINTALLIACGMLVSP